MKAGCFEMWAKAALIRAVKTMAQGAVAMIGAGMVSVWELDWKVIIGTVITMGILSILTSVAGLPEVEMPDELTTEEVMGFEDPEEEEEDDGVE